MELLAVMLASFFNVFLLVMNSQFARDKRYRLAFCNSWLISVAAFAFTRIVAGTDDVALTLFFSAIGGSVGVIGAMRFHTWIDDRLKRKANG